MQPIPIKEWHEEARKRYGKNQLDWKFQCPACKHVASIRDYKEVDGLGGAAFSCIGRWLPEKRGAFEGKGKGPCNYAGGGLFGLNPIPVKLEDERIENVFDFADEPLVKKVDHG